MEDPENDGLEETHRQSNRRSNRNREEAEVPDGHLREIYAVRVPFDGFVIKSISEIRARVNIISTFDASVARERDKDLKKQRCRTFRP
jgi:hypothetical protein